MKHNCHMFPKVIHLMVFAFRDLVDSYPSSEQNSLQSCISLPVHRSVAKNGETSLEMEQLSGTESHP